MNSEVSLKTINCRCVNLLFTCLSRIFECSNLTNIVLVSYLLKTNVILLPRISFHTVITQVCVVDFVCAHAHTQVVCVCVEVGIRASDSLAFCKPIFKTNSLKNPDQ